MSKIIQLLTLTIFLIGAHSLSAVHLGNIDYEEDLLNDNSGKTVKRRKIVIDFNQTKPVDLSAPDTFEQEFLTQRLSSRIEVSNISGYIKKELTIVFRNINEQLHLIKSRSVMKELNYSKFSLDDPLITFESSNNDMDKSINGTRKEYNGSGLL